ncbi:hypothetical protein [Nesterenkonia halobia]|uniref:Uncharacterized protein n=1 Tax=Nesterenkonia halobia TaxID=37922 RepID=A0ABP6RGX2_9MICC
MTAETASQPDAPSPAETPAARAQDSTQDGTQDRSQEVVMALLTQQEALLAELRWAYDELERTQDSEIVQLKSRLARLEEQAGLAPGAQGASGASATTGASGSSGSAASSSFAARTRRRVALSLQDPDRAVREAGRRLRRPIGRIARRAGISR